MTNIHCYQKGIDHEICIDGIELNLYASCKQIVDFVFASQSGYNRQSRVIKILLLPSSEAIIVLCELLASLSTEIKGRHENFKS